MTSKIPIFFTGATGYIGGSVLTKLLAHPNASSFSITALMRSSEKADKLRAFGVTPVVGSFSDLTLVEYLAAQADIVFFCAEANNVWAIQAILDGLRKRHARTGNTPVLIHTSGTSLLTYDGTKIFDDSNPDEIEQSFPEDAPHRKVDLAIVRADQEGYIKSYIILPSTAWGIAKNPLVDAGIMNPYSQQIPALVKAALARGRAGIVGKGIARRPNVDIEEVADLYIVLYDALTAHPETTGHGRDGYYFGISDEHRWYDVSKEIGGVLVDLGLADDAEPTSFTEDELVTYFGSLEAGLYWEKNARGVAKHSRSIGWNPTKGLPEMLQSIRAEVEAVLGTGERRRSDCT